MADGCDEPHGASCSEKTPPNGLTKNEILIWTALHENDGPLKAYDILDTLKTKGVRAPMTVYRALDGLEEKGVVHKIEGLNSFVLCNHSHPHALEVFLVCENCPSVLEIDIEGLEEIVRPAAASRGFSFGTARLEVCGLCDECA